MRKTVLLLTLMSLAVMLAAGAALAVTPLDSAAKSGESEAKNAGARQEALAGEPFTEEQLGEADRFVAKQMREQDLPSVAVRVWAPGTGGYRLVRGEANLETGEQRKLGQPFRIASITKTFTATAVLQLVDEGKLETSDTLSEWYPDFPNAEKITVDNLLRMRSGIPDAYDKRFMKNYYAHPRMDITARELIGRSARKVEQFEEPGQETVYTNINFVLLQQIVRKVSSEPLGDRIEEGILEPLGMDDSLYPTGDRLPGTLRGYSKNPNTGQFQDKTVLNPAVPGGSGAMISTVRDLRPYSKALCEGGLLEPETQNTRLEGEPMAGDPDFIRYGQGLLFLGEWCGHNGTIFGFSSEMFYLPEERATIVVNVNRLDLDDESKSTEVFLGVSKILFPEHVVW